MYTAPDSHANTTPFTLPEALWLAAAFLLPWIFNPWGASAFELPKVVLLRALVLLLGVATLIDRVRDHDLRQGLPLFLPALLLSLAYFLTSLTSVNPYASFWGSHERQQGLLTLLAYPLLFTLVNLGLRSRRRFERLWAALVWGSVPVVALGLTEATGFNPLGWQSDAASPIVSTLGRSNFVGAYLVLVIPLTVRQLFTERRSAMTLLVALQLLCLALTRARAAWLGLAGGMIMGLVAGARAYPRNRRPLLLIAAAAVILVGAAFLILQPNLEEGSIAARLTTWRTTLRMVGRRPWLGYGPETFRPNFLRVYPPELVYYQGRQVVTDRAHNLWLDQAQSSGLLGVAALALLLVALGRTLGRGLQRRKERLTWIALTVALTGHLIDLHFSFETTATASLFWLLLTLVAALERGHFVEETSTAPAPAHPLTYVPALILSLFLIWSLGAQPLGADMAFWRSQQPHHPPPERLEDARTAVRLWPLEPLYRLGLAELYAWQGWDEATIEQLEAAHRLSPENAELWAAHGAILARLGEADAGYDEQAVAAYRRATELAPTVATYHHALGALLARQERVEEAITALERAVALDATDVAAYRRLAELYTAAGKEVEAAEARRLADDWAERLGE
jgi:O-antigen ligase